MNNEQHCNIHKQTDIFSRLNRSLTTQMFNKEALKAVHTLHPVKAVDGFESFSNTSDHPSIKELCLASLLNAIMGT